MAKKGVNYLYGIDFTDKKAVLEGFEADQPASNDQLVVLLKEKTGDAWTREETTGFSLIDAKVEYVGANDNTTRPTNSRFANIMIIQLGECCTEVTGRIYLHFN